MCRTFFNDVSSLKLEWNPLKSCSLEEPRSDVDGSENLILMVIVLRIAEKAFFLD